MHAFSIRFKSVKCVSSILNPPDFNALKAVSIGDVIITGKKIKIAPAGEEGLGVFFVTEDGTEIPLDHPMTENNPKKIICRLPPDVTDGIYTLKIVTRYNRQSRTNDCRAADRQSGIAYRPEKRQASRRPVI